MTSNWSFALKENELIEVVKLDAQNREVAGTRKAYKAGDPIELVPGLTYELLRAEGGGTIEIDRDGKTFTLVPVSSGTS